MALKRRKKKASSKNALSDPGAKLTLAEEQKKLTVTIDGVADRAATLDQAVSFSFGTGTSASLKVLPGDHRLDWQVIGPKKTPFTVKITASSGLDEIKIERVMPDSEKAVGKKLFTLK